MNKPRDDHIIATLPSREGGIAAIRNRNGSVNKLQLVFGKEGHGHCSVPLMKIGAIKNGRNKNKSGRFVCREKIRGRGIVFLTN